MRSTLWPRRRARLGPAGDFVLARLIERGEARLRRLEEASSAAVSYVRHMARVRHALGTLRRRPAVVDGALAAVLALVGQVEIWTSELADDPRVVGAAAALIATLALAWRRRAPFESALVALGTMALFSFFWSTSGFWPVLVVMLSSYSVASHCDLRGACVGGALALAVGALATLQEDNENVGQFLENFVFVAGFMVGLPWAAGRALRGRRLQSIALEDRAVALEREGEERARAAVAEERLRIARELHDVVGHALGVIVVQAGAERATLDANQESTRETLITIEGAGRAALSEMRRLLEMMRREDEQVALAPQPGLAQLDTLVENVRAAGLPVDLHVEGEPTSLPPGVDLSAYRIVQEALTNALKHAGSAPARVTVSFADDGLGLEIADDGPGIGADDHYGHGLLGMRERVALHGGSLRSGARPGGGYAVSVRLPLDTAAR
jgi:signal transduction histidine kinase